MIINIEVIIISINVLSFLKAKTVDEIMVFQIIIFGKNSPTIIVIKIKPFLT